MHSDWQMIKEILLVFQKITPAHFVQIALEIMR